MENDFKDFGFWENNTIQVPLVILKCTSNSSVASLVFNKIRFQSPVLPLASHLFGSLICTE